MDHIQLVGGVADGGSYVVYGDKTRIIRIVSPWSITDYVRSSVFVGGGGTRSERFYVSSHATERPKQIPPRRPPVEWMDDTASFPFAKNTMEAAVNAGYLTELDISLRPVA